MKRQAVFEHQGVSRIGQSQWHAIAEDGIDVLSVWEDNIAGKQAEAHVHRNAYDRFKSGMITCVVVQCCIRDPDTHNMIT